MPRQASVFLRLTFDNADADVPFGENRMMHSPSTISTSRSIKLVHGGRTNTTLLPVESRNTSRHHQLAPHGGKKVWESDAVEPTRRALDIPATAGREQRNTRSTMKMPSHRQNTGNYAPMPRIQTIDGNTTLQIGVELIKD